jgi:hypothetical protein
LEQRRSAEELLVLVRRGSVAAAAAAGGQTALLPSVPMSATPVPRTRVNQKNKIEETIKSRLYYKFFQLTKIRFTKKNNSKR